MPKTTRRFVIVAYVPVLHRGYFQFFDANSNARELYVIGEDLSKKVDYIRKDLRALLSQQVVELIEATKKFDFVAILNSRKILSLDSVSVQIIMPDEDISRAVGLMFKRAKVKYS